MGFLLVILKVLALRIRSVKRMTAVTRVRMLRARIDPS